MSRKRSPDRERAKELFLQHDGKISLSKIAEQLGVSEGTVRGWKSKDYWDANGTFQSKDPKNTERSNQRSNQNKRIPSSNKTQKTVLQNGTENTTSKTNTNIKNNYCGNSNAVGNAGGKGGPIHNKFALKTGEYETLYFSGDVIDEDEKKFINSDYDKYTQQYLLVDLFTIREQRMLKRIRKTENTPGGMVMESSTQYINRRKEGAAISPSHGDSVYNAKSAAKRVIELEESLTRVQARKQRAIEVLHKMEMDYDSIEMKKQEFAIKKRLAKESITESINEKPKLTETLKNSHFVWNDDE